VTYRDDRGAQRLQRIREAVEAAPFRALPTDIPAGAAVTLTTHDGQPVLGWFAAYFDDDDPDCGRGPTFRIVGRDNQVWEGPTCERGWDLWGPK
jgi:hypothetical protein